MTPNIEFHGYIGQGIFGYKEFNTEETQDGEYDLYANQFRLYDNDHDYSSNAMEDKNLYNSRGEMVDLSEYHLVRNSNDLYFENGYCLLEVMNNNGGVFITVIDENGKRLFEPIPYEAHGKLSNGLIALLKDGELQFINVKGETAIHLPHATMIYDFTKDGIARIEYEVIDVTLDSSIPAVQYIDTHGNEIF